MKEGHIREIGRIGRELDGLSALIKMAGGHEGLSAYAAEALNFVASDLGRMACRIDEIVNP